MNLFEFAARNARRQFGMLGQYDRWKLEDGDDPGRGGESKPKLLHCRDCGWIGDFASAVGHFRQTEHTITFKGTVQDFSHYRVTAEELVERR